MTRQHTSKGKERVTMFFSYLVKKLAEEKPDIVEDVRKIIDLHYRQEPGYKNATVVMEQLNLLIGGDIWQRVYFGFVRSWKAHEYCQKHGGTTASYARIEQQQLEERRRPRPDVATSATAEKSVSVELIDLTDSRDEMPVAAAAAAFSSSPLDNEPAFPLEQYSARKSIGPSGSSRLQSLASRRMSLPIHSKFQGLASGPPKGLSPMARPASRLQGPHPSNPDLPKSILKPASVPKIPNLNAPSSPPDFGLLNRMQRQIKEDTSRSIVFVHNTLTKLRRENPYLHQQALSVIDECLRRSNNRENGYEYVADSITQRLKALVILGDSSVVNATNFTSSTYETNRQGWDVAMNRAAATTLPPSLQAPPCPEKEKKQQVAKGRATSPSFPPDAKPTARSDDSLGGKPKADDGPRSPSSLVYSLSSRSASPPLRHRKSPSSTYEGSQGHHSPQSSPRAGRARRYHPRSPSHSPGHSQSRSPSGRKERLTGSPPSPCSTQERFRRRSPSPPTPLYSPSSSNYSSSPEPRSPEYSPLSPRSRDSSPPTRSRSVLRQKRQWSSSSSSSGSSRSSSSTSDGDDGFSASSSSSSSIEYRNDRNDIRSRTKISFKRRKANVRQLSSDTEEAKSKPMAGKEEKETKNEVESTGEKDDKNIEN